MFYFGLSFLQPSNHSFAGWLARLVPASRRDVVYCTEVEVRTMIRSRVLGGFMINRRCYAGSNAYLTVPESKFKLPTFEGSLAAMGNGKWEITGRLRTGIRTQNFTLGIPMELLRRYTCTLAAILWN